MSAPLCLRRARWLIAAPLALLAACAPAPVLKTATAPVEVTPADAAALAEHFAGAEVVWGGELLDVRNRGDSSEVVVLAYPLDRGQRPRRQEASLGRFIAVVPGYLERYDYPTGRYFTVVGTLHGEREELVGEQHYRYAIVDVQSSHLWPPDFDQRKWHISVGVGASIR